MLLLDSLETGRCNRELLSAPKKFYNKAPSVPIHVSNVYLITIMVNISCKNITLGFALFTWLLVGSFYGNDDPVRQFETQAGYT